MNTAIPGPRSKRLCAQIERVEAPGINTLSAPQAANVVWAEACGSNVLDADGNRYIDLTSGFGVAAVGHRHPAILAAIDEQTRRLVHGLGDAMPHESRITLAAELCRRAPIADARVYFAISGADAVEIALKSALLATGKSSVLAFVPSYHGLTLGALAVSSRAAFKTPFLAHLHRRTTRLPFGCPIGSIADAIDTDGDIACLIVEPIVGREGVLLPPDGWLAEVARLCRQMGVLLIADEILTGFGRTGSWFACQHDGVAPDLLCCGKALGGGMPISAVVGDRRVLSGWSSPGEARHTATFVAHPLACAAALAALEVIESEDLVARATELGAVIADRVDRWPQLFPAVKEVRGRGLLWGIELESIAAAKTMAAGLRTRGILALCGGHSGTVLNIMPALTIARSQLTIALDAIEEVARKV